MLSGISALNPRNAKAHREITERAAGSESTLQRHDREDGMNPSGPFRYIRPPLVMFSGGNVT